MKGGSCCLGNERKGYPSAIVDDTRNSHMRHGPGLVGTVTETRRFANISLGSNDIGLVDLRKAYASGRPQLLPKLFARADASKSVPNSNGNDNIDELFSRLPLNVFAVEVRPSPYHTVLLHFALLWIDAICSYRDNRDQDTSHEKS
ncbi:hypothetical protein GGR55DRAFT_669005 [Xylaria sp. FL0064]|nr:hypothetical protein GGR55DRAFT_669005 [Xylaria sp. FL0064]